MTSNNKYKKLFEYFFITAALLICISLFNPEKIFGNDNNDNLVWVDTSHWEIQNQWVTEGYWKEVNNRRWVDTSYLVKQGYWSYDDYYVWVNTSHWVNSGYWINEEYKVWVNSGYYKTDTYYAWVKSGYYVNEWVKSGYFQTYSYKVWVVSGYWKVEEKYCWVPVYDPGWGINRQYPVVGSAGHANLIRIKSYVWMDTSHWETRYSTRWVDTSHWQSRYIDTSHWQLKTRTYWVDTSHYETRTRKKWIDTSYHVSSGYWDRRTGRHWVDTSYYVNQGYWENYKTFEWVDTSHPETKKVWVTSGYYTEPMHGKIYVEKSPKYVFTKWHKDQNGEESKMNLKIAWEIDNSNSQTEKDKKRINRVYVYEDVVRYNGEGVERVEIFNNNVSSSESGYIEAFTKFEHGGSPESILHIYLYSENGEIAHVSFSNPINGFRSINIHNDSTKDNSDIWLEGILNEEYEF